MPQKRGAIIHCFYPANGTASQQVLISNRHNTPAEHGVPQGRLKNLFTNVEPETKFLSDEKRGPKSEAFWVANSIKQPQNLHHCLKHGSPGQRERERRQRRRQPVSAFFKRCCKRCSGSLRRDEGTFHPENRESLG